MLANATTGNAVAADPAKAEAADHPEPASSVTGARFPTEERHRNNSHERERDPERDRGAAPVAARNRLAERRTDDEHANQRLRDRETPHANPAETRGVRPNC
jgi:hypothetical protein